MLCLTHKIPDRPGWDARFARISRPCQLPCWPPTPCIAPLNEGVHPRSPPEVPAEVSGIANRDQRHGLRRRHGAIRDARHLRHRPGTLTVRSMGTHLRAQRARPTHGARRRCANRRTRVGMPTRWPDVRVKPVAPPERWPRASSRPRWPDDAKSTLKKRRAYLSQPPSHHQRGAVWDSAWRG
jgi:hypothetical protein